MKFFVILFVINWGIFLEKAKALSRIDVSNPIKQAENISFKPGHLNCLKSINKLTGYNLLNLQPLDLLLIKTKLTEKFVETLKDLNFHLHIFQVPVQCNVT